MEPNSPEEYSTAKSATDARPMGLNSPPTQISMRRMSSPDERLPTSATSSRPPAIESPEQQRYRRSALTARRSALVRWYRPVGRVSRAPHAPAPPHRPRQTRSDVHSGRACLAQRGS
eukprot:1489712-Prymnesium_polylepis.2